MASDDHPTEPFSQPLARGGGTAHPELRSRLARAGRWRAPGVLCALLAAAAATVIFGDLFPTSRGDLDQEVFHLRAVRMFAAQWPAFDLVNYSSATTPGYHLLLAAAAQVVGTGETAMRLLGATFGVALVGLAASYFRSKGCSALETVLLALPLAVSLYTFSSTAWVLPDDAAWLAILAILIVAFEAPRGAWLLGGTALLFLVLVRQIQVWAFAPLLASAWIGTEASETASLRRALLTRPWPRLRRSLAMVAVALPAFGALVAFFLLWGGAVPPAGEGNAGGNAAMPVVVLALAGGFGTLLSGYLWRPFQKLDRKSRVLRVMASAAIVAALLSLLPPTSHNVNDGRSTGVWEVAERLPTFGDHSLLMIGLAGLGGAAIAAWAVALRRRDTLIWLTAWIAFIAANSASEAAWQRYLEPFVLIMFALAASRLPRDGSKWPPAPALAGLVLTSGLLAGVTVVKLVGGGQ